MGYLLQYLSSLIFVGAFLVTQAGWFSAPKFVPKTFPKFHLEKPPDFSSFLNKAGRNFEPWTKQYNFPTINNIGSPVRSAPIDTTPPRKFYEPKVYKAEHPLPITKVDTFGNIENGKWYIGDWENGVWQDKKSVRQNWENGKGVSEKWGEVEDGKWVKNDVLEKEINSMGTHVWPNPKIKKVKVHEHPPSFRDKPAAAVGDWIGRNMEAIVTVYKLLWDFFRNFFSFM